MKLLHFKVTSLECGRSFFIYFFPSYFFLSLNIRHTDVLTIFDGRDLMSHVIGQYLGSRERFKVTSGGSEVTIQFQSDLDDSSFILSQGFLIRYRGTLIQTLHIYSI